MYLIVGLGNPEPEYSMTRHNMGFDVINELSNKYNIDVSKSGFESLYGKGIIEEKQVMLCKPQTFMNLSGDAVIQLINFYKIDIQDLLVIYDDIDTEIGKIRIKRKGSAGGHKGIESIIYRLGTEEFNRVKIGIGAPEFKGDMINHVIGKVPSNVYEELKVGINMGKEAAIEIIIHGIDIAMNKFN